MNKNYSSNSNDGLISDSNEFEASQIFLLPSIMKQALSLRLSHQDCVLALGLFAALRVE